MIRKIEDIENVMIDEIKKMILSSFPVDAKLVIEYYLGEEEGNKKIYFMIASERHKTLIYRKSVNLKAHQVIADVEEEFISTTINDLVVGGVAFMHNEAMLRKRHNDVQKEVRTVPFKHVTPPDVMYMN